MESMEIAKFFKNKKVFITGHTGFKGAWLSQILLTSGAELKGYALAPNTEPSLYDILDLGKNMQSVFADIRDAARLEAELKNFAPDIVLHLAAQPLVRLSYAEPALTFETNAMGAVNLFEAVRKTPCVRAVVNITSDKCYENRETNIPYKETDPMGGFDPYSCSKGVSELITACYRRSFNLPLASCRAGNVIGGGDWAADRIVPDCARSLSQNKKIILRNPSATRPWQHVLEPLCGYLLTAQKLCESAEYAQGFNFGPEASDTRTVVDLVKKFTRVWGGGGYEIVPDGKLHEAKLLSLDISKAKSVLGWRPVYDFDKAVAMTAEWYKAYYDGRDAGALAIKQIEEYLKN